MKWWPINFLITKILVNLNFIKLEYIKWGIEYFFVWSCQQHICSNWMTNDQVVIGLGFLTVLLFRPVFCNCLYYLSLTTFLLSSTLSSCFLLGLAILLFLSDFHSFTFLMFLYWTVLCMWTIHLFLWVFINLTIFAYSILLCSW